MKKTGILAILLAGALGLGVCAGCGENGKQPEQTEEPGQGEVQHTHTFASAWTSDETHHWHAATCGHEDAVVKEAHSMKDGACSVCGYKEPFVMTGDTDIHSLRSDVVTESEWEAAFLPATFENFRLKLTEFYVDSHSKQPYVGYLYEMEFDGSKGACKISDLSGGELGVRTYKKFVKDGETITSWKESNGEWIPNDFQDGVEEGTFSYRDILIALGEKFSSFTYDEEAGAYISREDVLGLLGHASSRTYTYNVIFIGGVFCGLSINFDNAYGDHPLCDDLIVYDYGKAEIVLPQ